MRQILSGMRSALRLLTLGVLAGCSSTTDPAGEVSVVLQQPAVTVPTTVSFTVRNFSAETVQVVRACKGVAHVEVFRNGEWAWRDESQICAAIALPPVILQPGDEHTESIAVVAPGAYRIQVRYGFGEMKALYRAVSATITANVQGTPNVASRP